MQCRGSHLVVGTDWSVLASGYLLDGGIAALTWRRLYQRFYIILDTSRIQAIN